MIITNKERLKVTEYLKCEDLEGGDCFYFLDDSSIIYLMSDDSWAVDIETGYAICTTDTTYSDLPVKIVNVEVTIENEKIKIESGNKELESEMEMSFSGIIRRIDDLGRIVIPKELRRTLNMREGDPIEIYKTKNGIFLKKVVDN